MVQHVSQVYSLHCYENLVKEKESSGRLTSQNAWNHEGVVISFHVRFDTRKKRHKNFKKRSEDKTKVFSSTTKSWTYLTNQRPEITKKMFISDICSPYFVKWFLKQNFMVYKSCKPFIQFKIVLEKKKWLAFNYRVNPKDCPILIGQTTGHLTTSMGYV